MRLLNIFFALTTLCCPNAMAQQRNPSSIPASQYVTARPAAMGMAFTAVADDQNAMWYNPAGMARLSGFSMGLFNPFFETNRNTWEQLSSIEDEIKKVTEAAGQGGDQTVNQINGFLSIINSLGDKNLNLRMGINPYLVFKYFGIGAYSDMGANLTPEKNPEGGNFGELALVGNTDIRIAGGYAFFKGKLKVGGALAYKTRVTLFERLDLDAVTQIDDQDANKKRLKNGKGIGLDAGILFSPVQFWEPTLGIALRNIGDVRFSKIDSFSKFSAEEATNIPQALDLGLSITPRWGGWFTRAALDFREVNLPIPAQSKLALGFEGGYKSLAKVQMGFAEGDIKKWSLGLELRLYVLNIRLASYAQSRSYLSDVQPERKLLVQFKVLL